MKKILIAVDDTRGSQNVLSVFYNFVQQPVEVVLLHVQRLQGGSLMIDMLGKAEMTTLREMLDGTDYKAALDKRADHILSFYSKELALNGSSTLKMVRREGIPSDKILEVAEEEGVELIILGQSGKRGLDRFITGEVSRYVESKAKVPVLVAKRPLMCEEPFTTRDAYAAISVTSAIVLALFLLGVILEGGPYFH